MEAFLRVGSDDKLDPRSPIPIPRRRAAEFINISAEKDKVWESEDALLKVSSSGIELEFWFWAEGVELNGGVESDSDNEGCLGVFDILLSEYH